MTIILKKAANLDIETEVKDGRVDMCESLERKYKEKEIVGAIGILRDDGKSEADIIERIIKKYNVTKEYVMSLLSPKLV